MTEQYWQNYVNQIANQPLQRKDQFWTNIRQGLEKRKAPKHHLQLYSMCRSENPYIRQIRSSPNITNQTVAQLICRDKACQLQYCLSLMKIVAENKRNQLDLKGCQEQYDTMWNCINVQRRNLIKREQQLRQAVFRIRQHQKQESVQVKTKQQQVKQKQAQQKIYI